MRWSRKRLGRKRVGVVLGLLSVVGFGAAYWWASPALWTPRPVVLPTRGSTWRGFTADGRSVLIGNPAETTALDLATGQARRLPPQDPASWRIYSGDRRSFAGTVGSGERGDAEVVWGDLESGTIRSRFSVGSPQVRHLAWRDGDRSIRVILKDRNKGLEVVTWDLASDTQARKPISGPQNLKHPIPLAYSADGRLLAYFDDDQRGMRVWDADADQAAGGLLPDPSKLADNWRNAQFTRDGKTLIVSRGDGRAEVWDLPGSRLIRLLKVHNGGVSYVQASPDGRLLASIGFKLDLPPFLKRTRAIFGGLFPGWSEGLDQEVTLVDLATGRQLARVPGASWAEFSPDGRTVVIQEGDGTFSVRDTPRPTDQ